MLIAEYVLISLLFDAQAVRTGLGALSALHYIGSLGSFAIAAAAATLAMMGRKLLDAVTLASEARASRKTSWTAIAAHVGAYLAFVLLCSRLFGHGTGAAPSSTLALVWAAAALAVGITWLPLAIPWQVLRELRGSLARAALIGCPAGGAAWLFSLAPESVWDRTLGPPTVSLVQSVLRLFSDDVAAIPERLMIASGNFEVRIGPPCSGFEGIGLILVLLGGYFAVERERLRFPRVLLLLPIAVVTIWVANIARLTLLLLLGRYVSAGMAMGGFHSKAGWLFFCAIALGFVWIAGNSKAFALDADQPEHESENSATPYLLPFLVWLAASLVTSLFAVDPDAFDVLYPVRVGGPLITLYLLRGRYAQLHKGAGVHGVALGFIAYGLWLLLAHGGSEAAVAGLRRGLEDAGRLGAALWLTARLLGACVAAPVIEELAFRGYLMRRLTAADFAAVDARSCSIAAWIVSSVAFGVLHEHDWLAATIAGLAYGLALRLRGRLGDAVVAHAVTNALLCAEALAFGHLRWLT